MPNWVVKFFGWGADGGESVLFGLLAKGVARDAQE